MTHKKMPRNIMGKLSIMMFLQFFIRGTWFVTLGTYLSEGLHFDPGQIGRAYSALPWGAILSPFLVGMIADRFFPAQKVIAVLHLMGGATMFYAATVTQSTPLFWTLFLFAFCYNPTLSLVNTISFNQMASPEKQFPGIRLFGSIGWIAAGLIIGFLKAEAQSTPFIIAGIASLLLGVYSLFLPNTPPKSLGHKISFFDVLGLETIKLIKQRSFAIFVVGALLVCISSTFYYNFANMFFNNVGWDNAVGKMTLGQISELGFMLVMPLFFVRLGIKRMLLLGMLAWVVRSLFFAFGNTDSLVWMFYIGILLHGICFNFFFVAGQIYVDNTAPHAIRAQAQGFMALLTNGIGAMIGANLAGFVVKKYTDITPTAEMVEQVIHWQKVWLIPTVIVGLGMILFAALFKEKRQEEEQVCKSSPISTMILRVLAKWRP